MTKKYASNSPKSGIAELGELEILKILVDYLPLGAGLFAMDGRLLRHNPEFARLYGMDKPAPLDLLPEGVVPSKLTIWQLIEAGFFDHLFDDAHRVFTETFQDLERGEDHFKAIEVFGRLIEIHDRPIGNGFIISTHIDVTERIHAQQEAEYLAWHDPLTGLPNRTKLLDDIAGVEGQPAAVELDGAGLRPLKVVTISVEPYRRVLATLGYSYSDAMMRTAVARLKSEIVGDAKLYDLREGVLAVLVRSGSTEDAIDYAYRLAKSLGEPLNAKGIPILAECRLGIAGLAAGADNPVTAIRAALAALEDARDQHSILAVYDADRDDRRRRTVSLLADFQDALASEIQLRLYLQPKIDLQTQRCNGFEALLR